MTTNALISDSLAVLYQLDPVSQAPATVNSGWIDMKNFLQLMAFVDAGVIAATGTIDVKFQQATSAAGAGAKDISPAKAITQLLAAGGNNRSVELNIRGEQLDAANGFEFIQLVIVVGTAATLLSAIIVGANPRQGAALDYNVAGVVQTVK